MTAEGWNDVSQRAINLRHLLDEAEGRARAAKDEAKAAGEQVDALRVELQRCVAVIHDRLGVYLDGSSTISYIRPSP